MVVGLKNTEFKPEVTLLISHCIFMSLFILCSVRLDSAGFHNALQYQGFHNGIQCQGLCGSPSSVPTDAQSSHDDNL